MSAWGDQPAPVPLTVDAVRAVLDRAGIDYSGLDWDEDDGVVIVCGPDEALQAIRRVLFDRGLVLAQYPGRDEYRRADPRF